MGLTQLAAHLWVLRSWAAHLWVLRTDWLPTYGSYALNGCPPMGLMQLAAHLWVLRTLAAHQWVLRQWQTGCTDSAKTIEKGTPNNGPR